MKINVKNRGGFIVFLCSLVYFVSYFARKDFAAVMAAMLSENIIDKTIGGFIGMGLFAAYGVGQLVSGYLGDRIKPRTLLILGLSTTAFCNFLMPWIPTPGLMIPVWALNGFAQAMLWPPIVRILADNLEGEKFVLSNLVVTSSAHVSTIILYIFVPVCLKFYSWETVFFAASILACAALIVFVVSMGVLVSGDGKGKAPVKQERTGDGFGALFLRAGMIPIFFAIVCMGFLRDGIESWLPTLYSEAFERAVEESILLSAILPLFSILSILVITVLHKYRLFKNESRGVMILFGIAAVFCLLMSVFINFESAVLRIVCLVLAALVCSCMHAVNFLYISCLPARFKRYGRAATASGFSNACTYVGAAISMYGIGALSELVGWSANVLVWMVIALVGAVCSIISMKKYSEFIKEGSDASRD